VARSGRELSARWRSRFDCAGALVRWRSAIAPAAAHHAALRAAARHAGRRRLARGLAGLARWVGWCRVAVRALRVLSRRQRMAAAAAALRRWRLGACEAATEMERAAAAAARRAAGVAAARDGAAREVLVGWAAAAAAAAEAAERAWQEEKASEAKVMADALSLSLDDGRCSLSLCLGDGGCSLSLSRRWRMFSLSR
jgi:hypothetical protein